MNCANLAGFWVNWQNCVAYVAFISVSKKLRLTTAPLRLQVCGREPTWLLVFGLHKG